jgi:adenine-specific DNA methylase
MDYLDALDLINEDIRVVYADPPYTRDHYSRFYHVLETICLRDNPRISTTFINGKTNISRGIYRQNRHQSPFCIISKAVSAFEGLFKKVRRLESSLVLSYSPFDKDKKARPRLLTIDELENIAKQYYKKVRIFSVGDFSHSKLNCSDKNFDISYNAELLIICEP